MNKSELLHWLQQQNRQWEAFLDQSGEERMDQGGVAGDWSIKDIIAHLAVWQRGFNARLGCTTRRRRTAATLAGAPASRR
jgi:hypothetical protein